MTGAGERSKERPGALVPEQLAFVQQARARVRSAQPKAVEPLAEVDPIARVAVDVSLAHLDRIFDYAVSESMSEAAQPGTRVRVRFAGRLVDGFVVERTTQSQHPGSLARLARTLSPEPVLHPEVLALSRAVADRYAGVLADVLRLAVPPRHAAAEAKPSPGRLPSPGAPGAGPWIDYPAGEAFLRAVSTGRAPIAVWTALPGPEWPIAIATAVCTALAAGRGALVVVADARDVARVSAALSAICGVGHHVELTADLGPAERYRRFLAVSRGAVRCVVGTRAAQFAPVHDLGLAVIWDDGDDLHAEQHAPYAHVREVLRMRVAAAGSGLLIGGHAMTAEARHLLDSKGAHAIDPARDTVRARAARVRAAGDDDELGRDAAAQTARLPQLAWRTAQQALKSGPVLVQVPRRGYLPSLACVTCRTPARCLACAGPLALAADTAVPHCRWCGRPAGRFACRSCSGTKLRAQVVGAGRTAEELGRAFPGVPVRTSGRDAILVTVGEEPALIVATPGAEPVADGGYAAALLLDGWALLGRADLRAGEETLRRWLAAAALVRPGPEGGRVVVMADGANRVVQSLVRWDPTGAADRELADRRELGFPPVTSLVEILGSAEAVNETIADADLPSGAVVLGPQPVEPGRSSAARRGRASRHIEQVRAVIRAPEHDRQALARGFAVAQAHRSARKASESVRIRVDPVDLG